jgi:hypothetical protein
MRLVISILAGLIMTGDIRAEENQITVRGLSQRLQLTGWNVTWPVQGEIVPPVHPLRGGNILALLKSVEGDSLSLVLWNKEGHELGRSGLEIAGEIEAAQVFGNRLLVVTAGDVVEIDTATLHKVRARSFVVPATKTTLYEPCPTGVWVVGDKAVWYLDLDGRPPVERARPLVSIDKPRCADIRGERKQNCSFGLQLDRTRAVASEEGALVLIEIFKELYPYSGGTIDEVWPSTATVLDRRGAVVAQKPLSWMKTRREWFWFKEGSSHSVPAAWPQLGGVVRTRYETESAPFTIPFASRGSGFLFWNDSHGYDDMVLFRTDEHLQVLWRRGVHKMDNPILAPSWISPPLFHDDICRKFLTLTDGGSSKKENIIEIRDILLKLEQTKFKRPRFAIGQNKEGDWLLIAY